VEGHESLHELRRFRAETLSKAQTQRSTEATLSLDRRHAREVLALAQRRLGPTAIAAIDDETIRLGVGGVTYVPVPMTTSTIPALLTL
jgi:hypothetical protein